MVHDCRLVGPLLARLLTLSSPNTAAVARTTVGVTRMNTGSADNVLPNSGSVMFNFRLLPGVLLCCAAVHCAALCCAVLPCATSAVLLCKHWGCAAVLCWLRCAA